MNWRVDVRRMGVVLGAAIAALAFIAWVIFEPRALGQSGAKTECEYTYQQSGHKRRLPELARSRCVETRSESHEDDAYAVADPRRPATLVTGLRHYLHKMILDPVSFLTLVLALSTVALWRSTRRLWRGAEEQAKDFRNSIKEAERSAAAMESVAASMSVNAAKIVESVADNKQIGEAQREFGEMNMRAYLSVLIGGATYQEREKNLRFDAHPVIKNTGNTPARHVKWRARAAILSNPLPPDYKFTLPPERAGSSLIGPHQTAVLAAVVDEFVPDDEVEAIKAGSPKALYVWGLITYRDVFGKRRRVTFCQQMYWLNGDPPAINGMYISKHNHSD